MRKAILAVSAALALGLSSNVMAFGGGETSGYLEQGSTAQAGSISGATTVGTGFAGTYGISNMNATSSGQLISLPSYAGVAGTSSITGHSESGTLVQGAGAAGSIAGGEADAGFYGEAYFYGGSGGGWFTQPYSQEGDADATGGSVGSSWAATGSIGDGSGLSVQGFSAQGNASATADIDQGWFGNVDINTDVATSSGASSYTIEEGNAIGQTHSIGWGFAGADAYRVHGNDIDN